MVILIIISITFTFECLFLSLSIPTLSSLLLVHL